MASRRSSVCVALISMRFIASPCCHTLQRAPLGGATSVPMDASYDGIAEVAALLDQQARPGRVDEGEERAVAPALRRQGKDSGSGRRVAGRRQRHAAGGGLEPPPADHQDRQQHRGVLALVRSPATMLADWY